MSVMFKAKCSHSNVRCSDTDQEHGGIMPNQGALQIHPLWIIHEYQSCYNVLHTIYMYHTFILFQKTRKFLSFLNLQMLLLLLSHFSHVRLCATP